MFPTWYVKDDRSIAQLGFIPQFLSEDDPRPALEQLDSNYAHGGGWHKFEGFTVDRIPPSRLSYPGDPDMHLIAWTRCNGDWVGVFEHAWVCVVPKSGDPQIARMD